MGGILESDFRACPCPQLLCGTSRLYSAHTAALSQFPMNEIILKFDKMMPGRPKSEKREVLLSYANPFDHSSKAFSMST